MSVQATRGAGPTHSPASLTTGTPSTAISGHPLDRRSALRDAGHGGGDGVNRASRVMAASPRPGVPAKEGPD